MRQLSTTPRIILENATPDAMRAGGAGLTLQAGIASCPFGLALIATCEHGICHLALFDPADRDQAMAELITSWPQAKVLWNHAQASRLARRIFAREAASSVAAPWQVFVRATPFQLDVWRALLDVPASAPVSYGQLATIVGHPQAARAVGTAVGQNPVAFLIPCHRVIRHNGDPGQYRWGAVRKQAILEWEHSHTPTALIC